MVVPTTAVQRRFQAEFSTRGGAPSTRPGDWVCECGTSNFARREMCFDCGKQRSAAVGGGGVGNAQAAISRSQSRPGDWYCECGTHNFASRSQCMSCGQGKPATMRPFSTAKMPRADPTIAGQPGAGGDRPAVKNGDWFCSCGFHNFASRTTCFSCQSPRPARQGQKQVRRETRFRPGDWICEGCGFTNFAARSTCKQCEAQRTEGAPLASPLRDGDWPCPACKTINYSSRTECFSCKTPKGGDAGAASAGVGAETSI